MDSGEEAPVELIGGATGHLIEGYEGSVCDMDGVVYRGRHAMPSAAEPLLAALAAGGVGVSATMTHFKPQAGVRGTPG